jgi:cyd operon protein YbgT
MWYFTWILGLGFAAAFAAMNAMWLELNPGAFEGKLAEVEESSYFFEKK